MTDHIPDAGKKVSTPKNLDGMVVDAEAMGEWLLKKDGDPRFCAGMVQAKLHDLARPERASTSQPDAEPQQSGGISE